MSPLDLRRTAQHPFRRALLAMLGLLLAAGCAPLGKGTRSTPADAPGEAKAGAGSSLMSGVFQLTFEGRRSGEGYFDRSGTSLVFQSEREPGNPFYQIQRMNLETGDVARISSGIGKSTCAWIHPSGARVLYASTHLDPDAEAEQARELADRAAGSERRYAWDYDDAYDLFEVSSDGESLAPTSSPRRLTVEWGYDAEASWSPNGRHIVFASNRHAYRQDGQAAAELVVDPKQFSRDPAHFIELYLMDADGRNVRRLTNSDGYDGGPFFGPDGSRIVWRRFAPDGATAEIFSMRVDGSDVKQLTTLGAMSWAPFYHPSGEYIVFTTNLHGFDNFELYIVDVEGRHAPVRVTDSPGFDGLPVFAPDGERILWTSNRTQGGGSQLFSAGWDDAAARLLLELPSVGGVEVAAALPLPRSTRPSVEVGDLQAHVAALADDVTEGRLSGTPGARISTSYLARYFRSLGLEPAGDNGSYFQEFGFVAGVSLGAGNTFEAVLPGEAGRQSFIVDQDWRPFAFSQQGEAPASEVVYAGYGIVAPEATGQRAINAYDGLDVTDRWVLVFRYVPEGLTPESRQHLHRYSSLRYKAMVARDRGARGLLVVSGPNARVREQLAPLRFDVSLAGSSIAALSITDDVARRLLAVSGRTLGSLQDAADSSSAAQGFVVEGVKVSAKVALEQEKRRARNVLARLRAGERQTQDAVVLGAHADHLGRGEGSSSLARADERGEIHPGADDNASGVATLLEIAEWLAAEQEDGNVLLERDIVFAAWSGEELGLLGSSHYVSHLVDPHQGDERASDFVAAYLNMDMVGRMDEGLSLFGLASSPIWRREIEHANATVGLPITPQNDAWVPSDATSFVLADIPMLSAYTGAHTEYHTPRDTADTLDFETMRDVALLMGRIAVSLAEQADAPAFTSSAPPGGKRGVSRVRVYLGTIPDYARSDIKGVLLSGVAKDGPAQSAGVRGGDIVVELAGTSIENIYDYTYALDALKIDEPAVLVVERDGERIEIDVTPASRE